MYDIIDNNFIDVLILLLLVQNIILSFALASKLNSLNKNLYKTFKFNGFLQNKPKEWDHENFNFEDLKENV